MLSIAKVSNQSLQFVENALSGMMDALINLLSISHEGGKSPKYRLNFKVGHLHIYNGALQFASETFNNLLHPNKSSIRDKFTKTSSQAPDVLSQRGDETKSILYDHKTQKREVNAETLT